MPKLAHFGIVAKCTAAALDCVADSVQQYVGAEWLGQELDSSGFHGLDCHRHVTVARDEDDRHIGAIDDALLQVQAAEVRKSNVKHQATRSNRSRVNEEF